MNGDQCARGEASEEEEEEADVSKWNVEEDAMALLGGSAGQPGTGSGAGSVKLEASHPKCAVG